MKNKKVIALMNAFGNGVSGGDVRFVEIAKRIFKEDALIITSDLGVEFCLKRGLKTNYAITTTGWNRRKIIIIYIKRIFAAIFKMRKYWHKNVIVYASSDFMTDVIPAFFVRQINSKATWIQVMHHFVPNPFLRKGNYITNILAFFAQRVSLFLIRRKADRIMASGPELVKKLKLIGFSEGKIYEIHNGVDVNYCKNYREESENMKYDAVFIGKVHPSKGVDDLLEIWKLYKKDNKNYKLAIVGKGEENYINKVRSKINNYGLEENVILCGYVSNILDYLKISKIFVFPSYEEGWGIVICEALACAKPVIVYDLEVYKGIFTEGVVKVPIGDKNSFGNAIIDLLQNEDKRRNLGVKGSNFVERYDWDNIAESERGEIFLNN